MIADKRTMKKKYVIKETLHQGNKNIVSRAIRKEDNQFVLLKYPNLNATSGDAAERLQHEYIINKKIDSDYILQALSYEKDGATPLLVMEDFPGEPLAEKIYRLGKLSLTDFLETAVKIIEAIADIHRFKVIHKDINPGNIIIGKSNTDLKVIDFGISTIMTDENLSLKASSDLLEGTLSFMSPEQTGRMNRTVDYRTDYYSLGITLYQMITGSLPFDAGDELKLIHAHMAKMPIPPHRIYNAIPQTVSDIIMKLMEKIPERRYKSLEGLKHDLKRCSDSLREKGNIDRFEPGLRDFSTTFIIPQKLYGREKEKKALLEAYKRVEEGRREILLVAGYSGIGKSRLVNEIHKYMTYKKGRFISGKFDLYQRGTAYYGLISAVSELVEKLLSEDTAEFKKVKTGIMEGLETNGSLLTEVFKDLEKLTGKLPSVPELEAGIARYRFTNTFKHFLSAVCDEEHPLVLFLDDLQWADSATLTLIESLITDEEIKHFLLIGAYRTNEVDKTHNLSLMIDKLREADVRLTPLTLKPLKRPDVENLLCDVFITDREQINELSALVYNKTEGNPFFINQFLHFIEKKGHITFNRERMRWEWDIERIENAPATENVVELISAKLDKIPDQLLGLLQWAACIGNRFELNMLTAISGQEKGRVYKLLIEAIQRGILISPEKRLYISIEEKADVGTPHNNTLHFSFVHDRIQQAVYSTIDQSKIMRIHLKIGRYLMSIGAHKADETLLLETVDHINKALELIDKTERDEIAELELSASRKAKKANAYDLAYNYALTGITLLGENAFGKKYELTRDLHMEAAESAYLSGNYKESERLIDIMLNYATTPLDRAKALEIQIVSYSTRNRYKESIDTLIKAIEELGITISREPSKKDVILSFIKTKITLLGKTPEKLKAKKMTDPKMLEFTKIAGSKGDIIFQENANLSLVLSMKLIRVLVRYGNVPSYPEGYILYSMLLAVMGDIKSSFQYMNLAREMTRESEYKRNESMLESTYHIFVSYYKIHLKESLSPLLEDYRIKMENGKLNNAASSLHVYCYHAFYAGRELKALEKETRVHTELLKKNDQRDYIQHENIYHQTMRNLIGLNDFTSKLKGDVFDEDQVIPQLKEKDEHMLLNDIYMSKLIISYLFGDSDQAVINARETRKSIDMVTGMYVVPTFYFYESLAILGQFNDEKDNPLRNKERALVRKNRKKLRWFAKQAPINFLHKYYLVEAEFERVKGNGNKAESYYRLAINTALENDYIQEAALGSELTARFYLKQNDDKLFKLFMTDAVDYYESWGADAKAEKLRQTYNLNNLKKVERTDRTETKTSETTHNLNLDTATLVKAAQSISGEITMEELLKKLSELVIENAGAERVVFLLNRKEGLMVESEKSVKNDEAKLYSSKRFEEYENIPKTIVMYTLRTSEIVIMDDASDPEGSKERTPHDIGDYKTSSDEYIHSKAPKSILCMPVTVKGETGGILYLENNLVEGAFTEERVKVLKVIASQLAITLENIELYENMESLVENRTHALSEANNQNLRLINNAGQGFLTVGRDLRVTDGYSVECEAIFGRMITGEYIHDLLYPQNREEAELLRSILEEFVKGGPKRTVYMSLIPEELKIFGRYIKIETKLLEEDEYPMMFILSDISEKKELENKVEKERNILKMIVKVVSDKEAFINLLNEYREFCNREIEQILAAANGTHEKLLTLLLRVHTFKGNFSLFGMNDTVPKLHEFENELSNLKELGDGITEQELKKTLSKDMYRLTEKDVKTIEAILGKGAISSVNTITMEKRKFRAFERFLEEKLKGADKKHEILTKFEELRFKPLKTYLRKYPSYTRSLAERQGKRINPFEIESDEILVDIREYNGLISSLVHIFRNCVSHGIEPPEERAKKGKSEFGTIRCQLGKKDDRITLTITDDGRGIDPERIKSKATKKGIISKEMAESLSKPETLKLIFREDFSTEEEATDVYGRGVGISSVKKEAENMGGTVTVKSTKNIGTSIIISVPYSTHPSPSKRNE